MELPKLIGRRLGRRRLAALVMLALTVFLYSPAAAQTVRRVALSGAGEPVVFNDAARPGERDTYVFKLEKGESCEVEVEWQGADVEDEGQSLSGLTIVYPNGERLVDAQDGHIEAGETGDYKVVVAPATRKTNYRYRIIFTYNQ